MVEYDFCFLERKPGSDEKVIHCNNPDDVSQIELALSEGYSFRKIRELLGYAGKFKKIPGKKRDGSYFTNVHDAEELHLGLKEGHTICEIMESLGYTGYGWDQTAHGYAIQKLWRNDNYDVAVTPSVLPGQITNYRSIFLKRKDGEDVDIQRIYHWINDSKGRTEEEIVL